MNVIIVLLNLIVIAGAVYFWWKHVNSLRVFFLPALFVKLAGGLLLGFVYTYYYTIGDTFVFFRDATVLSEIARHDFLSYLDFLWQGDESFPFWPQLMLRQTRSLFLTKLVSVFNILTFDNYWISCLYFSLLSFAAAWNFVNTIVRHFPQLKMAAVLSILFFPSVVFWGSGIIKESLALAALYFLSGVFLRAWQKERTSVLMWITAIVSLWILWNLRYYFAVIFIPVVATSSILHHLLLPRLGKPRKDLIYGLWFLVFSVLVVAASLIHPNFYLPRFLDVIVSNYQAFEKISRPEDMIHFNNLQPTATAVLVNSPWALMSGLFRPFLWEAGNLFQGIIAVENSILLILFIAVLPRIRKLWETPNRLLLLSLLVYACGLCIFITLATPNFGTLSRYRIGYLPFFTLLVMADNPLISWTTHRIKKFMQRFTTRAGR